MKRRLWPFTIVISLVAISLPASAQETVNGVFEYEALPPGVVVETVITNEVILHFDPDGGPFAGQVILELVHDVPDRGCQFQSVHTWDLSGTYDPDTGRFTGVWVETQDTTTGECENFNFVRDFDPDQDDFTATLVFQTGEIRGRVSPADISIEVDPTLFQAPTTNTVTDATTDPGQTSATEPLTTQGDELSSGFPSWLVWVILLVLLILGAAIWLVRSGRFSPTDQDARDEVKDCSEEERSWREARDACQEAQRRSERLSNEFDRAAEELEAAQRKRASLPSEETRVELPDGRSLSQLDLELRRTAASAAWDEYLANPNPETAAAAEQAWEEQATPEWLEEQRQLHEEGKERLEQDVADARADKERLGKDLADARSEEQRLCTEAEKRKAELDACLDAAKAAVAAAQEATPEPQPETPPPPRAEPEPPTETSPAQPSPEDESQPCPEGASRWVDVDGPHPFIIPIGETVKIRLSVKAGTQRRDRLTSLDLAGLAQLDPAGKAVGFTFNMFAGLTPEEIRGAFSGEQGLSAFWATAGSGAEQTLALTLSYTKRTVLAMCQQKEVCVDAEWKRQPEWKTDLRDPKDELVDTPGLSLQGNISAGFARSEETHLQQLVAFFRQKQGELRLLLSNKEEFDKFLEDCRAGRRRS